MSFKKEHFNKRWNITSSDSDEETFRKFKTRIQNIFETIECSYIQIDLYDSVDEGIETGVDKSVTKKSIFRFCQYYGISQSEVTERTIIDRLNNEANEKEFYRLIEVILSLEYKTSHTTHYKEFGCEEDEEPMNQEQKSLIIEKVKEAFYLSDVNMAIGENSNRGIILYPKREKNLDEELVNKTLSFLNKESNKHFEEALKSYQSKKSVKSAESLRRSLEEFLRCKLENKIGLKENINTLQKKLKESNNSQSEIRNIIFQIFNYLDKYFNEHSKHGDGNINEVENEFLIYQTGLLMRYIDKVDNFQKEK